MSLLEDVSALVNQKVNKIEELKQTKTPKEVFESIKRYAHEGHEAIPEDEKSFFLKCFGIFYRENTPGKFMMRIRTCGGVLSLQQAQTLGELAVTYGEDYIDITTRAAIELRYLHMKDIPTILETLERVGLTSFQTGVDNMRSIIMDPLDGFCEDSLITCKEIVQEMEKVFLKNEAWIAALPRKFNTAITGSLSNRCNVFGQDCGFVLAKLGDKLGFSPFLGARTGSHATPSEIFVEKEQVVVFYEALLKLFKTYGFRHNRNKNRFKFLLDEVGKDEIIREIESTTGLHFEKNPEILTQHNGEIKFTTSFEGKTHLHCPVPCGVFSGSALLDAVNFAHTVESDEIRLSVEQNFIILNAKTISLCDTFVQHYAQYDNTFLRNIVACAGKKHCPFGLIEAKEIGIDLAKSLQALYPEQTNQLKFYWSCCPKGCGIHEIGDFGFVASKAKIDDNVVEVVSIFQQGELIQNNVTLDKILDVIVEHLPKQVS